MKADTNRYNKIQYRNCGISGLKLPAISLGFWQNFGAANPIETQKEIIFSAFNSGICHFDFANNYGPPFGAAESNFGEIFHNHLRPYRDELIISSKAGWDMWPGPYGGPSGSRKHIIASADQSLKRLGLDYVDIFYSHRPDENTPLEETMQALIDLVRAGKALYVGISSYGPKRSIEAAKLLKSEGVPLLISQPNYSMLHRWIENGLLDANQKIGAGTICFSPLQQGLLSGKYLEEIPAQSRAREGTSLNPTGIGQTMVGVLRALNEIAIARGQTLAQMAISFVLRDARISSALIGVRNKEQLDDCLGALENIEFDDETIEKITEVTKPLDGIFTPHDMANIGE